MPQVTKTLIILNVVVFVLQQTTLGYALEARLSLWPLGPLFAPWQVVTYAFLHQNFAHIFFNMFGLFMFGSDLERVWGEKRYLTYYAVSVLSAAAAQLIVEAFSGIQARTIGASGGVFGLLLAFAMYFPHRRVVLLFPPIPMPAWVFATVYGGIELFLGVTGAGGSVAHFAHLGGMAGGYVLIRSWRSGRRRR